MFVPRIGFAWSPSSAKNVVLRGGFGIYADRGEYFTELSASAGLGISGPFSVTTQEPFTVPVDAKCNTPLGCFSSSPFGTGPIAPPPNNLSGVAGLIFNQSQLSGCPEPVTPTCTPTGNPNFDFLFGGYDPTNKLPYSENWSTISWQPKNDLVTTLGYLGNRGVHQPIPVLLSTSPALLRRPTLLTGRFTATDSRRRMLISIRCSPSRYKPPSENSRAPTATRLCARHTSVSIPTRISGRQRASLPIMPCKSRPPSECPITSRSTPPTLFHILSMRAAVWDPVYSSMEIIRCSPAPLTLPLISIALTYSASATCIRFQPLTMLREWSKR